MIVNDVLSRTYAQRLTMIRGARSLFDPKCEVAAAAAVTCGEPVCRRSTNLCLLLVRGSGFQRSLQQRRDRTQRQKRKRDAFFAGVASR